MAYFYERPDFFRARLMNRFGESLSSNEVLHGAGSP
jgi:hypothetical protein